VTVSLCRPSLGKREEEAILSVLRSGHLVSGRCVTELERKLTERMGGKRVLAVSNGTAALHIALIAAGVRAGDEVIVPSLTYPAPVNVVELVGATPVLVDVCLETACMDMEQVKDKISDKTSAIMPVHQFGIPADMGALKALVEGTDIKVIEDAACALGSLADGEACGSIGHLGCFSFHPRKVITTGEGGAVVIGDDALYAAVDQLRNHGQDVTLEPTERFVSSGYNLRMSDLHGGIGVVQMDQLDDFIQSRRSLAKRYSEGFEDVQGITMLPGLMREGSVVQSLVARLDATVDRESFFAALRARGVEVTIASYGIHRLPMWRDQVSPGAYPNAELWHEQGITLPLFPRMEKAEVDLVIEAVKDILRGVNEA